MRIVCPACAAAYDVPAALLHPPGRVVRCARCGEEWAPPSQDMAESRAEPSEDEFEPPPPMQAVVPPPVPRAPAPVLAADAPLGVPQQRESAPADPARGIALAGWLATVLVLGAAGWAAYAWRPGIEAAWPPSQRAYAMLGLP